MFLPKCQNCGRCGCDCGRFPYTVTISSSGLSNKVAVYYQTFDPTRAPPFIVYTCELVAVSCFGSGAAAKITQPGGCSPNCINEYCPRSSEWPYDPLIDDSGPIEEVKIINPGSCYAKLGRIAPTITASVPRQNISGGSQGECVDVALTVSLEVEHTQCDGQAADVTEGTACDSPPCEPLLPYWYISEISVAALEDSCKYEDETPILIRFAIGDIEVEEAEFVLRTDEDGVPQSAEPVVVDGVERRGKYYRESKDAPPYVADVRFELESACLNSAGEDGAFDIRGVVGDDPYSPSFGRVIDVEIIDPGDGWLAWTWKYVCHKRQNGQEFVLAAADPNKLITVELDSCYGSGACFEVAPFGSRIAPPDLRLASVFSNFGGLTYIGCNSTFTYDLQKTTASDGGDAWTISKASASGGKYWLPSAAVHDTSLCTVYESTPFMSLATDKSGTILSSKLIDGGRFYLEYPYDGSPGPIKKISLTSPGEGYAKLGREEPTGLRPYWLDQGESPVYFDAHTETEVSLARRTDGCGVDYWEIDGISVEEVNFTPNVLRFQESVYISPHPDTKTLEAAKWTLTVERDEAGDVVEYTLLPSKSGKYYNENPAIEPYVSNYTIVLNQSYPSAGSGAKFKVTIDDDTASPTFGQVEKIEIIDGGDGYTILGSSKSCYYGGPCSHGVSLNTTVPEGGWSEDGVWGGVRGCADLSDGFPASLVAQMDASNAMGARCPPQTCGGSYAVSSFLASVSGVDCDISAAGDFEIVDGHPDGKATLKISPGGKYNPCRVDDDGHDCGYCPDFRNLCITAEGEDWQGNKETISSADCTISYSHSTEIRCTYPLTQGLGWHQAGGFFEHIAIGLVRVTCDSGKIYLSAEGGPTGQEDPPYPFEECGNCTSWSGTASIECSEGEDWYEKTVTIVLSHESPEFCEGCPDPGTVTVTITKC